MEKEKAKKEKLTEDQEMGIQDLYRVIFNHLFERSKHIKPSQLNKRIEKISRLSLNAATNIGKEIY
jgi:hypothetical protein